VRAFWRGNTPDPIPADVAAQAKRGFDPDAVSGPLEAALLRRFGRMGRAVLRLVSANFETGSVDAHLWRSLKALCLAIFCGWACIAVMPIVLDPIYLAVCRHHIEQSNIEIFRMIIAIFTAVILVVYMLWHWGVLHLMLQGQMELSASFSQAPAQNRFLNLTPPTTTRGDNRYPLTEITGLFGGVAGLLLGLPFTPLAWTVVIAVPALAELHFFLALNIPLGNKDYRRSWLLSLFRFTFQAFCAITAIGVLVALIIVVCKEAIDSGEPWIGWLGSINILLVFDVAFYMLARWIYVRRRFDAERWSQQNRV
jgi:hypothetical protein